MALDIWKFNTGVGSAAGFPSTLQLANGNFMVIWSGNGNGGMQYAIFDRFGRSTASGPIDGGSGNSQQVYGLEPNANGGFTLLYRQVVNNADVLSMRHFDANAQPIGAPITVANDILPLTNLAAGFEALPGGGHVVVYSINDGADVQNIALRIVGANGVAGNPIIVNTTTAGRQFDARVATNGDNLFISWWDEATGDVRGQMMTLAGQRIGSEFLVQSDSAGSAGRPHVETLSSGNYVVVWEVDGGPGGGVSSYARIFNSAGNPVGGQFLVNEEPGGGAPNITVLPDDSFIISYYNGSGAGFRWFDDDGTPRSGSLLTPTIPGGQTSLVSLGDGRIAAFGIDSFLSFIILDTRGGNLNGDEGDNILVSTRVGDSTIYGFGGNDQFFGNDDNDLFVGGAGNDVFQGGLGQDRFLGGTGDDTYYLTAFSDNIHRTLYFENPGEGNDTVITRGFHYMYANVENGVIVEDAGTSWLVGNASDNILTGNNSQNLLIGGGGNDIIYGGGSRTGHPDHARDSLFGEAGNDTLYGQIGVDYLAGGIGHDKLYGGEDADELYGEDGDDLLDGGATFDTDILVGGAGNDQLLGNSGLHDYDLMDGGAGDDVYYVDTGDDLTFEAVGGGTDTVIAEINLPNAGVYLYANVENLELRGTTAFGVGNELDNRLTGNASVNTLLGGAGNDILNGKGGNDVLFGQDGADIFLFERGTGGDVIGDFLSGTDKIDLAAFGLTSFAALQAGFSQVGNDGAINLGNGDFIVLHGVTMSALTAGDFIL
ncbi:hypothetical protein BWQ93_07550 [Sphingopyxis sp. QXT-31]|uniref:calcium-binding protein n=1 Tax=Sphingopyxis sp. QXT-31 TaxID=1357916 RepID=UPI0009790F14|nr:calcium-binding protein [Sphingopyxis sp. QXT-31]APZ98357.1 hypothetical protein BWQ93_07550 [Sphingopyxis sp. QXT-31]